MRRFKKTYIEITNSCNLSCNFCPKTDRPAQFMDKDHFERILKKIKGYSEYLYFHVMGEPLLHKDIGLFLDLCKEYGYRVNITTNGVLIDKAADFIISKPSLRQVNFSLHSFNANEDLRAVDKYLSSIFGFIHDAEAERELLICLRLWNLKEGNESKENDYILHSIEKEFNLDFRIENKLTPCRGIKISENIFLNQASRFDWPEISLKETEGEGFCYGLRDQVAILVDGTVVPCCLDRNGIMKLGNVYEQEFADIIGSERAMEFYEGYSKRKVVEPLCQKCGYRKRFNI